MEVSSLDCNGSDDCSYPEKGQLWYSNTDNLAGTTNLSTFATKVTNYVGTSGGTAFLSISLSGAAASATYLYFVPGPSGSDNDHLIWQASYNADPIPPQGQVVPAPAGLILVASGLVVLIGQAWRHRP